MEIIDRKTYVGQIKERNTSWMNQPPLYLKNLDNDCIPLSDLFKHLCGKNIKVIIEVEEEKNDEPMIHFPIKTILKFEEAIEYCNLNPYCVNEGLVDEMETVEIPIRKAKEFGLLEGLL
jgi:hypothetical protein